MTIKTVLKPALLLPWIFRVFVRPTLILLPARRRNQVMTIAHHIKTTLFHGHIMDFGNGGQKVVQSEKAARNVVHKSAKKVMAEGPVVPSWVVDEMFQLAEVEPDLFPTPEYLAQFHAYRPVINDAPGKIYAICRRLMGNADPDIIFIAPWLKRGGADLGTLHHINVCRKLGLRAALVTTLDAESPWLGRVPKDVPVVELGRVGRQLTEAERMIVLVRLMLQTKALTIHIIQSQLGWEMLKNHGKSLLAEGKSVFASLYSDDFDSGGQKSGYARYYLASTLPYLSGIICDSAYYPSELSRRYGVDNDRTHTVYFPAMDAGKTNYISSEAGKVLWASRIAQQKRPDLLLKIAMAMPDIQFHVRGHAETPEEKQIAKTIGRLPNVTFTGSYETGGLVQDEDLFSLFLYTSAADGMPNVLLEATLTGLPIVASSVGGIPELINEETGYIVDEVELVEAYVTAIRRALDDPEERRKRWSNAIDLIQKRHSHENFLKQMERINGYFYPAASADDLRKLRASA